MTFANPLPWWALLLALVAIAALAWQAGWKPSARLVPAPQRAVLVALRVLGLSLLVLIVMRPVRLATDPAARGTLVVLLDSSRSMGLPDADGRSRLNAAVALVRDRLAPAVEGRMGLEVLSFGQEIEAIPLERLGAIAPVAPETDLARALQAVRRRSAAQGLAGVVLVSDGGFSLPEEDARAAPARPVPVYAIGVGGRDLPRDREVRQLTAGDANVAGATVDLTATVVSAGFGADPAEVRLSANGRPLEVRRVPSAGDGVATEVLFSVAPDPKNATLYTVATAGAEGELTAENNRRSVLVPPAGRPRRVLLLEGAPGFEHSFLKRALDQDKALELDAVVRKGANEAGQQTFYVQGQPQRGRALMTGFPASRQALFTYDAVILANLEADALTRDQLQLLADYVGERGGGLLVMGARALDARALAGTILEELLPVEISDRVPSGVARATLPGTVADGVTVTSDGQRHPVMRLGATAEETRARWQKLPALPAVASVGQARAGATVLALTGGAGGMTHPLVAVQRYGRGRVLAFSGEAAWRWRMLLPSTDTSYPTFWRQAVRWLATATPEPVAVRTRATGVGRIEVQVEVRDDSFQPVRDAAVRVTAPGPNGPEQVVEAAPDRTTPGTYRLELRVPPGVTRVDAEARARGTVLGRQAAWTVVGPDPSELMEPRRNDAQLARIAQRFGGRLVTPGELPTIVGEIAATRRDTTARVERDAWHSPWLLLALLGVLVGEWTLRRQWGMR